MAGAHLLGQGNSIVLQAADNGASNSQSATFVSLTSSGLTVAWTKVGSGERCDFFLVFLP